MRIIMAKNEMAGRKIAALTLNALKRSLFLFAILLTACTKDGSTIYMPDPNEEAASTAPLVTVIYGPGDLGDRRYCDQIYEGVEKAAATYGLRTMQMSPQSYDEGLQYLELMFRQMAAATDTVRRLFIVPQPAYDSFIRQNSHRLEANPYADLLYLEKEMLMQYVKPTLTSMLTDTNQASDAALSSRTDDLHAVLTIPRTQTNH